MKRGNPEGYPRVGGREEKKPLSRGSWTIKTLAHRERRDGF